MEIVTRKDKGLFPSLREISLSCSCPDWATMCKHVAATLYGVGARLDHEPEMLFTLRGVDPAEMVKAAVDQPPIAGKLRKSRRLASDELSSVFGVDIDMDEASLEAASTPARPAKRVRRTTQSRRKATSGTRKGSKAKPAGKKATKEKATTRKYKTKKATRKKAAARKPATKKTAIKKRA
jgi:uncharacterized Zn finger protein